MAGRIPRDFIDGLIGRADIVDIVEKRVKLKKAGKNYQACCPFHNEKSPSFTVSQDKQFYHCFGCGAHGNAIGFLMEYDNLEFVEAIEDLAGFYGVTVPREEGGNNNGPTAPERKDYYELLESVTRFYQYQLKEHPNKRIVNDYLKQRGLSADVIAKYGIGYAAPGWDNVLKRFGRDKHTEEQLLTTGVLIENEGQSRRYDRFRERVMFPIRDKRGRVIGYGGRVLGDEKPKYLNSPETPIFHKGKELYGLYEVRQAYKEIPQIVVVEGYMDVVALAQFGINYAVASLGTSTSGDQMQTLFRNTNEVICCYDGDKAGRDAAWRALENALPQLRDGKDLKFVFLPDGEDPDSLVRNQGKDALEQLFKDAQTLPDFLFSRLSQNIETNTDVGRSKLASQAKPLIEKMPDGFYRGIVLKKLARFLAWDEAKLNKLFTTVATTKPTKKAIQITPIRRAIGLLVQNPHIGFNLPVFDDLPQLKLPGINILLKLLEQTNGSDQISTAQLLEYWRDTPEQKALIKLAVWDHGADDAVEAEFFDTLFVLSTQVFEQRFSELQLKLAQGGLTQSERLEYKSILDELKSS
ncbi:DNA primase [Moritella sp. F3]|uniref:DNA primase n=1 Tax=Moritella sp. F3 TaxID=2718882 RepID=UPI0018E12E06|nr:DNA primase [Moritella sp. F3]GIC78250.1 DNA primase [Moritella sp. F1]GIC82522.1 DNA primase [Moritella sp. F3]